MVKAPSIPCVINLKTAFLVLQKQQNITVCTWPYEFEIATVTSGRTAKTVKDQYWGGVHLQKVLFSVQISTVDRLNRIN